MNSDNTKPIKIGVITVSDRASKGEYDDLSGPAIIETFKDYLISNWEPVYQVIPDEQKTIENAIKQMADEFSCALIVTTGGTGLTAVELSCHWFTCHSVNNDCPSANVKPYCFVKYTEQVDCEG